MYQIQRKKIMRLCSFFCLPLLSWLLIILFSVGGGDAGEGLPPNGEPDTTLTLTVPDMQSMFIGQLKPLQAYMSGRLKVAGDLSAATQLGEVIKTVMKKVKEDRKDVFIV